MDIFDDAATSSQILLQFFEKRKTAVRSFSMSQLAMRLGIASRSNLSEALSGKRLIPRKFWNPLLDVLKVFDEERDLVLTMLQLEREKDESKKRDLQVKVARIRKKLRHGRPTEGVLISPRDAEVFCIFGMFQGSATQAQILSFFKAKSRITAQQSLLKLIAAGYLRRLPDGKLGISSKHLVFPRSEEPATKRYMSDCFSEALEAFNSRQWTSYSESYFESAVVSVNKAGFSRALMRLKQEIGSFVTEVETERADSIIRLNIQVYPVE